LPHRRGYTIATTRNDQRTLDISIFQGESEKAQENEYLGMLTVNDVPAGPRGSFQFDVQFALSAEALLTVTAEEHGTGRTVSATFTTKATPEEIRKRLEDGEPQQPAPAAAPQPQPEPQTPEPQPPAPSGGVLGWLRRLFGGGRGQEPRA
jgi:molecular chaperone DnaK